MGICERQVGAIWVRVSKTILFPWLVSLTYLADYFIVFSLGYDTENNCPLGTVEVYDPDNDTWSSIASLIHPRRRFGMAVVNGIIYVAGGYFEHSVEWYDEKNDQWRVYEGVTVNRHDFTCLALPVPHCW